jgi:acetolactate synthase small subunit
MHIFNIRYRNTQGTFMRILNAASRRGLDIFAVEAGPADHDFKTTLQLEVNSKQVGQLTRDWYAIVDVIDVHATIAVETPGDLHASRLPHPPAAVLAASAGSQQALA